MTLRSRILPRTLIGVAVLAAGPVLSGCSGVVKNLNSAQVNVPNVKVANPLGISNQAAKVTISHVASPGVTAHVVLKPRAGTINGPYAFTKQAINLSNLQSAELDVSLQPTVTLTGTGLPAGFTLNTFVASVEVDDLSGPGTTVGSGTTVDDSLVLPVPPNAGSQLTLTSSVHFTQQAGTNTYTADTALQVQPLIINDQTTINHLTTIVSGENLNKQAVVTLTATSPDLPDGTQATFTFGDTSLTVNANGS